MTAHESAMLKALQQVNDRLGALALEMTGVRTILDIQFTRIAELQAELDVLPAARRRREMIGLPLVPSRPWHTGNGRSHG